MGMMDNLKDKAKDMMDDPSMREKIEKYAKDHNISVDKAKKHFMRDKNK
jgi:hypothetical protein